MALFEGRKKNYRGELYLAYNNDNLFTCMFRGSINYYFSILRKPDRLNKTGPILDNSKN